MQFPTFDLLDKYDISRLIDGRLLWLREEGPFVLYGKSWVPAKGVSVGMSNASTLLNDDEIRSLISDGILPNI